MNTFKLYYPFDGIHRLKSAPGLLKSASCVRKALVPMLALSSKKAERASIFMMLQRKDMVGRILISETSMRHSSCLAEIVQKLRQLSSKASGAP